MRRQTVYRFTGCALLVASSLVPLLAQPVGPEYIVTDGESGALGHDVGMGGNGTFVHVWAQSTSVWARRYASNGTPLDGGAVVSEQTANKGSSRVGVASDGSFVVSWTDYGDGGQGDILGRRFSSSGAAFGSEFRVNTTSTGAQRAADVAVSPSGAFLVAWTDFAKDGSGEGIYAQRFASNGAPIGSEFRVNTTTVDTQTLPVVAATGQGGFVVTWQGGPLATSDVFAQVYAPSGAPVGGEIQVNSYTAGLQLAQAAAADATGDFVVTWVSGPPGEDPIGVYAQRFASSGAKLGAEFRVNESTTGAQQGPVVHMDASGSFLVVFLDSGSASYVQFAADGSYTQSGLLDTGVQSLAIGGDWSGRAVLGWQASVGNDLTGRRFALAPDRVGEELRVNTTTANNQIEPSVAGNADGSFVVAWSSRNGSIDTYDVMVQRFSSTGAPLGGEAPIGFTVNVITPEPAVAANAAGDFVVAWKSAAFGYYDLLARSFSSSGAPLGNPDLVALGPGKIDVDRNGAGDYVVVWSASAASGNDVLARRYSSSGAALGAAFRVNSYTSGTQDAPRVAMDDAGKFIVVWSSSLGDGGGEGVFGQRFDAAGAALGSQFPVNGFTVGNQFRPDVAAYGDGAFVVVWESDGEDGSYTAVVAQRYASSGAPLGSAFVVNLATAGYQGTARAATTRDGFAVVWKTDDGTFDYVRMNLFRSDGARIGADVPVERAFKPTARLPVVDFSGSSAVVAWSGRDQGQPGLEIFAERFRLRLCVPGDANGDAKADVTDVFFLINALFASGAPPTACGNANGDALTDVADVFYLINFLFAGGAIPI
jgi:hypothetical protein